MELREIIYDDIMFKNNKFRVDVEKETSLVQLIQDGQVIMQTTVMI